MMSIISKIASFLKEKDSYGSLERDFKKKSPEKYNAFWIN